MKQFKLNLSKAERVVQNLYLFAANGRVHIHPEDIVYLESRVNYTMFYTRQQLCYLTSFHLKFFGKVLQDNPDFLRINHCYIVNVKYLKGLHWNKDRKEAELNDGTRLAISRRKARELKETLWERMGPSGTGFTCGCSG